MMYRPRHQHGIQAVNISINSERVLSAKHDPCKRCALHAALDTLVLGMLDALLGFSLLNFNHDIEPTTSLVPC